MLDFLYYIIIFPLEQIIEISFIIVFRIFRDKVLAIVGVSAVFTVCTMPLYFIAEKFQKAERDIQNKLKAKVDIIKSTFTGDERYMLLSTYYKQNNYHPIFSLRSSLGLLIQIPFFIAAYHYLSHLDFIKGTSFLYISDIGKPDEFIKIGNFSVNLLPIIMTLINIVSGLIYTKGFPIKDKIQVYGLALLFLILLYNSPSALVLYWTMNNIFSLIKNILVKIKHWKIIVYIFLCLCAIMFYIRFIPAGFSPTRLFFMLLVSLIFFIPLIIKLINYIKIKIINYFNLEQCSLSDNRTFILSSVVLFLLSGLVIPTVLIASSVQEFSFLDSYTSPFPFIFTIFIQSAGFFLFWPLCIYFLFSKKIKYVLAFILSLLCVMSLINTFIFVEDYGTMSTTFLFSEPHVFELKYTSYILSSLITICILVIFAWLLLSKRKIIFFTFQLIILMALTFLGIINLININKDFLLFEKTLKHSSDDISVMDNLDPVYKLSRNGKNVIVFMVDAAVSGYIPYIFNEKPELYNDYSGFTYYPNNISFGPHTRIGTPPLFGGYDYIPENVHKSRANAKEKHNEALLTLPLIFKENNYNITITDPSFANYSYIPDLSLYSAYTGISAYNLKGKYTSHWLHSHPEIKVVSIPRFLNELLIRFSFFRMAPSVFKIYIYDKSDWLKPKYSLTDNKFSLNTIDSYSSLDYLPLLTEITDDNINTYTAIVNALPHDFAIFQYPDYKPSMNITEENTFLFYNDDHYHVNIATILLIGKWLRYLQEHGAYDNTRIIIVSDHGKNVSSDYEGNIKLPDGKYLSTYHSLLLVKDFDKTGELTTDNTFMTQGDVPFLAVKDIIKTPINPWTSNTIKSNKENGVFITNFPSLQYSINKNQWMHVKDNIFDIKNWKNVER